MPSRSGVAGPAAAALGIEHQRHAPIFRKREHGRLSMINGTASEPQQGPMLSGSHSACGTVCIPADQLVMPSPLNDLTALNNNYLIRMLDRA